MIRKLFLYAFLATSLICGGAEPPNDLLLENVDGQIALRWNDNSSDEAGFKIYRSEDGENFNQITTVEANVYKYIDNDVLPSTNYWYKVAAFNDLGESITSNIIVGLSNGDLINISTRGYVGKDDKVMITGFIVKNKSSKFLIRGIGPTLLNYGLLGAIINPTLNLYNGSSFLYKNDDWGGDSNVKKMAEKLSAFPIDGNSKDAAFLVTLPPGTYTIIMSGVDGGEGIGLIEIYQIN